MSDYIKIAKQVLTLEANEILRNAELIDENIQKAVELIHRTKGKVVVTGVGKSGHIGAKIAATLASTGTPSFFLHPTEAMHGDLGMISKDDIVLAISFSGESEELTKILPHIKRFGVSIISITKSKDSSLGYYSDVVLKLDIQKEACPLNAAPTSSTTLTLVLGDALAICLMNKRNFKQEDFANFHPGGSLGKRLFIKVKDIMKTENLPIVNENESLKTTIDVMTHSKLGNVLIVDKNNTLVAVLSDGDLRRALMDENFDINAKAIKYATKNPKVLDNEDMLAIDALALIEKFKIQLLIILKDNEIRGVLHIHDLTSLGLK
ncbi:D-arabinose 5-phosphate isomerase [Campylobacter pinnipediorum subsp. caledonicus]|uniref:D-arabinose 5-phosphate isomerase n=1 Tax=Campylobacter pinnipediorum subsp. caledonicus TaxID=1874362 RepID=A0A1S6U559_9BACT|nr:KpsF/GutQ family sugar-phosphate isomerase [Campylobacter pinnipediorum]AQW85269.1 D-arabinose 5-phosphate isomerase [Campylobacter pinnipediorum subsp. caledonicus]AQW86876.1 D-arabinose 5-phosphate isomerase [Campylobacter pinnipediorum subsp. caledonicus]